MVISNQYWFIDCMDFMWHKFLSHGCRAKTLKNQNVLLCGFVIIETPIRSKLPPIGMDMDSPIPNTLLHHLHPLYLLTSLTFHHPLYHSLLSLTLLYLCAREGRGYKLGVTSLMS
ncbi:unnamed protein product [Vicia faba]|uniref:Uncharacterized protein n=1 Tax=Vicia faba TaxID=3906 RepID=A0AAV1B4V4_VICFA|nr:unnamed protein product [Vicia faba]